MNDSELVEFLLNDDFNKKKILLNGPLDEKEETSKNVDSTQDKNVYEKFTSSSGNENDDMDSSSSTESEFLSDLDDLIMSTNNGQNLKKNKIKNNKSRNENNNRNNNNETVKTDKQSTQNKSHLQKIDSDFDSNNESNLIFVGGDSKTKIKLNNKTAIVKIQIFDDDTGTIINEKNLKISNSHKLILKTFRSKNNSRDETDILSQKFKTDKKSSFKFKSTNSDLLLKRTKISSDTSHIETHNDITQQTVLNKDDTVAKQNNDNNNEKNRIDKMDNKTKKREERKRNLINANKNKPCDIKQKESKNGKFSHGRRKSSNERKDDRKKSNINQHSSKRKAKESNTRLKEIIDSKVSTDEYSRTKIEF